MEKKLKRRAIEKFIRCINETLPSFVPLEEKNNYLFPGEKVWLDAKTLDDATLYILFCPEHKGRDQFTIEIGWSKLFRFPELIQRPSLVSKADFDKRYQQQEAVTRLSYLTGEKEWIDINESNIEEVIQAQARNLVVYGMPFLNETLRNGISDGSR